MRPKNAKQQPTFLQKALFISAVLLIILGSAPDKTNNPKPVTPVKPVPTTPQEKSPAQKMLDDTPIIEPVKSMTKIGVSIIEKMGEENVRQTKAMHEEIQAAAKAKRPVNWKSLNYQNDMPPEEHPQKWSRMQIGNQYCWLHVKTLKKICQ